MTGLPYAADSAPDPEVMMAVRVVTTKEAKLRLGAKLRRTPHPGPQRPVQHLLGARDSFFYALNSLIAAILVLIAGAAMVIVVGDAVVELWTDGRVVMSVLALVAFPLTFLIWPWTHAVVGIPLWIIAIAGFISLKLAEQWFNWAEPIARRRRERGRARV